MDEQREQELEILTGLRSRLTALSMEADAIETTARQFNELTRVADRITDVRRDLRGALAHLADTLLRGPGRPEVPRTGDGRPLTTKIQPPGSLF